MAVTIEKVGSRVYFAGNTFPVKDAIKGMGGHWDGDRKQWWVGAAKMKAAEELVAGLSVPRFAGAAATAASARAAASVGLSADTPAGVVADAVEERGDAGAAAKLRQPAEDLSGARVYAKVEYKGRTYYVIARTMTQATIHQAAQPLRVRLATLQEDGPVFWADAAACRLLKEYHGRDERGAYGKPTGRTVYTTLGSLRSFVADQRAAEKAGVPQCPVCGKRNPNMVLDHETGMTCCRGCADMPAE